jgi:hypothetical protein
MISRRAAAALFRRRENSVTREFSIDDKNASIGRKWDFYLSFIASRKMVLMRV